MTTEPREELHFLDYWRVISSRKEVVIAMFLLVVTTGALVTFLWMPRQYRASVKIQVKEDAPDIQPGITREIVRFDPLFLRTQFEVIQSRPIMEETIRKMELDDKLGKAYGYMAALGKEKAFDRTLKLLSRRMRVQQYRDTNLIEIQIAIEELKSNPEEAPEIAARVANTVAEVYRAQYSRRNREIVTRALEALGEAVAKRRDEVTAAEGKVEEIRQKYKLDFMRRSVGTDSALPKLSLAELESRRIFANQELIDRKSKFEKLSSLGEEERLAAAVTVVQDRALAELVAARRKGEVERMALLKDLGPKHPDVERVEAQIAELRKKTDEALKGLMTGLRIDYETAQQKYDQLTTDLEERKTIERNKEASGYREFDKAVEEVEHLRKIRDMLELRHEEEKVKLNIPKTTVEVIEPAKAPDMDDYDSPKPVLNIILSIVAGLGMGIGLAFFVEYMDTSVKTIDDIERFMGVPVVGVIPQKVRPFTNEESYSTHAEAYRVLRANIQFSKKFQNGKVLTVTSGSVGEGKSLTLFNLAAVCAHLGDRVLIVDSDLHRPTQHKILKVSNQRGLANILAGELELSEAVVPTPISKLSFLPSGKLASSVHGLLDTVCLQELVKVLREEYDYVFFDAPPMIGVSDTSILVREVDGVLLVIQHRKYPRALSNRAKFMLENVGANLVGVVLNNINVLRDYSYYGYGYYSYYAYSDSAKGKKKGRS